MIANYGKPMAAVIPIADCEALIEEIVDLRAARRAQVALEARREGTTRGRPYAVVREELAAEGFLEVE